ncbi:MAG TPA: prephenate dehydrogenase/arogenate dehydrogenase family protein [Salinisphaeraceae bacterium]|nr:prephenate dehydrogenase/arogenate dehydrogenase family protein [Salinisphaeraceae bacterium]
MRQRFAVQRIAIIGLGLIGGSLARALRKHAEVAEIVGCVRREADVALALELGLADRVTTDAAAAVRDADIVVLAVGIQTMGPLCRQLQGALAANAIITDVGSTKQSVIAAVRAELAAPELARFVPGHPIAGTENSGLRASIDGLFCNRRTILTPLAETEPGAQACIAELWQAVGAKVSVMSPAHHDEVMAATSHLPHLLAFALVDTLAAMAEHQEIFAYAAGGFADFTRIASSDPGLWTHIMQANRSAILGALEQYMEQLGDLRQALQSADEDTIIESFARAKQARDRFSENNQTRRT